MKVYVQYLNWLAIVALLQVCVEQIGMHNAGTLKVIKKKKIAGHVTTIL